MEEDWMGSWRRTGWGHGELTGVMEEDWMGSWLTDWGHGGGLDGVMGD